MNINYVLKLSGDLFTDLLSMIDQTRRPKVILDGLGTGIRIIVSVLHSIATER